MENKWVEPEKYHGQFNGNLYKACIDINYFDEFGFIKEDLIKSFAEDMGMPLEKACIVELIGYEPGNVCYDIVADDEGLTLYFIPIVVYSYNGDLYDVGTGLKVVPKEEGPNKDCFAVDRIDPLSEDELDNFMNLMVDADNSYEKRTYQGFIKAVHKEQLKTFKKYVRV